MERAHPGAGGAVRRLLRGQALAAAGAAVPVRGLRGCGSARGCRARCWSSRWRTGGSNWRARPSCWSCPRTGRGRRCAATGALPTTSRLPAALSEQLKALGGAGGDHALHDGAGRLPGAPRPLQRAGGLPASVRDIANRNQRGDGGAHRLLHQPAGDAGRPVGQPELPRPAGAGAGDGAGGLRAPGSALRGAGEGAEPGAQPGARAALPGEAHPPERALLGRGAGRCRACLPAARSTEPGRRSWI